MKSITNVYTNELNSLIDKVTSYYTRRNSFYICDGYA